MLARRLTIAILLVSTLAVAAPPHARVKLDPFRGGSHTGAVCSGPGVRCLAHVVVDDTGSIRPAAAGEGWVPQDLWNAYQIDPNITTTPTVAIVDAYGYQNLESDLATYRAQFGLPACTVANGCFTVLNQSGKTSPLPAEGGPSDDWTLETALDVDMVSAACPLCRIVVVQATNENGLFTAQTVAASAKPTVISDSWAGPEQGDESSMEQYFNHPGIAQFGSSGDDGWDDGGQGPMYPSTSAYVIAVGGTSLYSDSSARGFSEAAWAMAGSSCSNSIPKPSYQSNTSCTHRASADISAVADPQTGVIIYNAANGGWLIMGGTSAAAPIVASIFAETGNGAATAAQIAQAASSVLFDVTSGSNGSCGNVLCNAGTGWDGPTGYGTPSASALTGGSMTGSGGGGGGGSGGGLSVMVASPTDGSTVPEMFQVTATATGAAIVGAFVDGVEIGQTSKAPYVFTAPHMGPGPHVVTVVAADAANDQAQAMVQVVVTEPPPTAETGDSMAGGCSAGASDPGLAVAFALAIALVLVRRRLL
ncbi:MAG TPA: S53 family peptidase [Kofleriaceae bacterium]|nr:S53 family peptidase [Kofleriaceae bacterium]